MTSFFARSLATAAASSRRDAMPPPLIPSRRRTTRSMRSSVEAASNTRSRSRNCTSPASSPKALLNARLAGSLLYCSTSAPSGSTTSVVPSISGPPPAPFMPIAASMRISSNSRKPKNRMFTISRRVKFITSHRPTKKPAMGPRRIGVFIQTLRDSDATLRGVRGPVIGHMSRPARRALNA